MDGGVKNLSIATFDCMLLRIYKQYIGRFSSLHGISSSLPHRISSVWASDQGDRKQHLSPYSILDSSPLGIDQILLHRPFFRHKTFLRSPPCPSTLDANENSWSRDHNCGASHTPTTVSHCFRLHAMPPAMATRPRVGCQQRCCKPVQQPTSLSSLSKVSKTRHYNLRRHGGNWKAGKVSVSCVCDERLACRSR